MTGEAMLYTSSIVAFLCAVLVVHGLQRIAHILAASAAAKAHRMTRFREGGDA